MRKKLLLVIILTGFSASVIGWYTWNAFTSHVLSIDEVRRLIVESPGTMHFEVKPETINITSITLVSKDDPFIIVNIQNTTELPDKLYIIEYECQGRINAEFIGPPGPFKKYYVNVILDAYTGQPFQESAKEAQ